MTYPIRLPEEIEKRLDVLSLQTGRSKCFYVKEAILKHLSNIEDIYLAKKRLEDIYAGRKKHSSSRSWGMTINGRKS